MIKLKEKAKELNIPVRRNKLDMCQDIKAAEKKKRIK